jgi:hypothetical protein
MAWNEGFGDVELLELATTLLRGDTTELSVEAVCSLLEPVLGVALTPPSLLFLHRLHVHALRSLALSPAFVARIRWMSSASSIGGI